MIRDPEKSKDHIEWIADQIYHPWSNNRFMLLDVPRDVIWQLLDPCIARNDLVQRIILQCESRFGWHKTEGIYKNILPSLGRRAIPVLLAQLNEKVDLGDPYQVYSIVEGLNVIRDDQIVEETAALLDSRTDKRVRAGVLLCAKFPNPAVLDRLWEIRIDSQNHPEKYRWDKVADGSLNEETLNALKACVLHNSYWLEKKIVEIDPSTEPVQDLGYLVAATGNIDIWQRNKTLLKSKVGSEYTRSIATCVFLFRDRSEINWLESQVSRIDDWVGIVALRALVAIDPDRALNNLDLIDEWFLYIARNQCILALHIHQPEMTIEYISRKIKAHRDPLRFAFILQGHEDLIDVPSFDHILDRLSDSFQTILSVGSSTEILSECRRGLMFIDNVFRSDLLDRLRHRRGKSLEFVIEKWLKSFGPHDNESLDSDMNLAMHALAKIGGDGFSRIIDYWLDKASIGGKTLALEMAQRRFSESTKEILIQLSATRSNDNPNNDLVAELAVVALSIHHQWGPVVRFLLHRGCECSTFVFDYFPTLEHSLDDDVLKEVLSNVRCDRSPYPGAILLLGLANRRDLLPTIRTILNYSTPGSDLAYACLLALLWIRDDTFEVIPAIVRNLDAYESLVIQLLLLDGSEAACGHLVRLNRQKLNVQLAVHLANKSLDLDTLEPIRIRALDRTRFKLGSDLSIIVRVAQPEVLHSIAEIREVYEVAEEIAYSDDNFSINVLPAALRIIGCKQPDVAVRIAIRRLKDENLRAPEQLVAVIGLLASNPAEKLFELTLFDLPRQVYRAIGLTIGSLILETEVIQRLRSRNTKERLGACRIAGYIPFSDLLHESVRSCAVDTDFTLADAAVESHMLLMRSKVTQELVDAIASETDTTHLWVLIDAIVSVSDPGYDTQPPSWLPKIIDHLTPAMLEYLYKKIQYRRRKQIDELEKADKR